MSRFAILVAVAALLAADTTHAAVQDLTSFSGYKVIFRTGDKIEGSQYPIATLTDINGDAIKLPEGSPMLNEDNPEGYDIAVNPDFTSLHAVGDKVVIVSQFEADSPAALYVIECDQQKDGSLVPTKASPTDWSAPELQGLWVPCAGSYTPWGSHAGGEEYEPDAYCIDSATSLDGPEASSLANCTEGVQPITNMMRYWGFDPATVTLEDIRAHFNPYKYGHAFEVALAEDGTVSVGKHYLLGRHSYELWYVMPDSKTVYATDDGTNTAFWKFVADTAGDMSAGTLYGAKFHQLDAEYGGHFDIEWIELGRGQQQEVVDMVMNNVTFSDIFEVDAWSTETGCAEGFTSISKRDNGLGATCLKLKEGMETAAAFLESRRYLAYLNGTVEFSKWEGLTFDPATSTIYTAISVVRNGMEDLKAKGNNSTKFDEGGPNDVRLPYNPCGCVYSIKVDDSYNTVSMAGMLCGHFNPSGENDCDLHSISEPDNVAVIDGQDSIIIGEDTGTHLNDVMWHYVPATGEMTRIFSAPYGAETTSPYWFPDVNGHAYLAAAIQHPYGESDEEKVDEEDSTGLHGWVGAWAFKASDFANGEQLRFVAIPPATTNQQKHSVLSASVAYRLTEGPTFAMTGMDNTTIVSASEVVTAESTGAKR